MPITTRNSWDPFTRPIPSFECLSDGCVLLQSWKKSHSYLRSKSWFADVLELDTSALGLQQFISDLVFDLQVGGISSLKPTAMSLVLAPKTDEHSWDFSDGTWLPGAKTKTYLRPLAHLSLRDQVLNLAAVIALADVVETAQGNTELPSLQARATGVASYGNRLLCDWAKDPTGRSKAEFTWGNASCYRKYYVDYQHFLARPIDVCRYHYPMKPDGYELGVVSLDLQGFYDSIAPRDVIQSLKLICEASNTPLDPEFFKALEMMFAWEWNPIAKEELHLLKDEKLPRGIPQGLVASGFYSNAYMMDFDRAILTEINEGRAKTRKGLKILDYCRYVDDIRFVVEGRSEILAKELTDDVSKWVKPRLKKHIATQQFNESKSSYLSLQELESRTVRPTAMAAIQEKLSGPLDLESMEEVGGAIDGLLNTVIAEKEQRETSNKKRKSQSVTDAGKELPLSRIHVVKHTVRDDTVIRFSAYRKFKTLRHRRFYLAAENSSSNSLGLKRIDAEMELACRQLIHLWSMDPSLAIVLRHAMNLFPSPEFLQPVLEALGTALHSDLKSRKADSVSQQRQLCARCVALYTCGELLKAGVIETGIDVPVEDLPSKSDLLGYREMLGDFAESLLEMEITPWYVSQQAVMFLLSIGRHPAC